MKTDFDAYIVLNTARQQWARGEDIQQALARLKSIDSRAPDEVRVLAFKGDTEPQIDAHGCIFYEAEAVKYDLGRLQVKWTAIKAEPVKQ